MIHTGKKIPCYGQWVSVLALTSFYFSLLYFMNSQYIGEEKTERGPFQCIQIFEGQVSRGWG